MKRMAKVLVMVLMLLGMTGYALAHCGHCGISDCYICTKDNVASEQPGKCSVCGADLAKGDIKEVTTDVQEGGKTVQKVNYVPAPANS